MGRNLTSLICAKCYANINKDRPNILVDCLKETRENKIIQFTVALNIMYVPWTNAKCTEVLNHFIWSKFNPSFVVLF